MQSRGIQQIDVLYCEIELTSHHTVGDVLWHACYVASNMQAGLRRSAEDLERTRRALAHGGRSSRVKSASLFVGRSCTRLGSRACVPSILYFIDGVWDAVWLRVDTSHASISTLQESSRRRNNGIGDGLSA